MRRDTRFQVVSLLRSCLDILSLKLSIMAEALPVVPAVQRCNNDQKFFFQRFFGDERRFFYLTGGPGSGKSWCIKVVAQKAIKTNLSLICCGMTAQATLLLPSTRVYIPSSKRWAILHANTLAGTIMSRRAEYRDRRDLIVVVDECGMMTVAEGQQLMSKYPFAKILLVGDPSQLQPVNGTAFVGSHDYITALKACGREQLTEVVLGAQMRIATDDPDGEMLSNFLRDLRLGKFTKLVETVMHMLSHAPAFDPVQDPDAIVVAFTNADVSETNRSYTEAFASARQYDLIWFPVVMSNVADRNRFYGNQVSGMAGPFCRDVRCIITKNVKEDGRIIAANNQPVVMCQKLTPDGVPAKPGSPIVSVDMGPGGIATFNAGPDGGPPIRVGVAGTVWCVQGVTTERRLFINLRMCTGDGLYVAMSRVKRFSQLAGASNYDKQRLINLLERPSSARIISNAITIRARKAKQQYLQSAFKRKHTQQSMHAKRACHFNRRVDGM